ncbi:hypothetical protein CGGC5_v005862 [Colletotrichum fructicola Nara gc5]|uniref:BTB domain-containing protein n=1 Tax=Colletotrichum fructicola (strain Nara gc5) TaxID=1213859 RepID=A0A7J6J867_COLFN|nr:hypothetical protein CGGC5_v005862 [Colletotrichum fructicola Nara gc5]
MTRKTKQNATVYAEPSKSERIRVYRDLDCRAIFSEFDNSRLRKRKAIESVVRKRNLWVPSFSTERLVTVIQSLQKDSILGNSDCARRAFPELFCPQESTPPVTVSAPAQITMASASPSQEDLFRSLKGLYETGVYSDLTISSVTKSYSVHRAIVCPRSDFLTRACRSSLKEAADGAISLPDDEPLVIDMMIHISQSPKLEDTNSTHISCLLLHAKVYAAAEKYAIGGLKDLAVAKLKTTAIQDWDPTAFLDAASEAYTSTIDTDRGLRDAVIEVFRAQDLLYKDKAKVVVERLGPLGYDLCICIGEEIRLYIRERNSAGSTGWPPVASMANPLYGGSIGYREECNVTNLIDVQTAPKTGANSEGQIEKWADIRTSQEFARQSTTIRPAACDTQLAREIYTQENIAANPDN